MIELHMESQILDSSSRSSLPIFEDKIKKILLTILQKRSPIYLSNMTKLMRDLQSVHENPFIFDLCTLFKTESSGFRRGSGKSQQFSSLPHNFTFQGQAQNCEKNLCYNTLCFWKYLELFPFCVICNTFCNTFFLEYFLIIWCVWLVVCNAP